MAHRHKVQKRAAGGVTVDGGGNPNVIAEAKDKRRASGGRAKKVDGASGKMAAMRLDKPGRKTGGRVGADKAPLTGANRDKGGTGADTKGPFEAPK